LYFPLFSVASGAEEIAFIPELSLYLAWEFHPQTSSVVNQTSDLETKLSDLESTRNQFTKILDSPCRPGVVLISKDSKPVMEVVASRSFVRS